jgi:hypothetical protein
MKPATSTSAAKRIAVQFVFGMALLAGASGLLQVLDHERNTVARAEQLAYLPKGEYLKLAVLGYRQIVADLIWLQAVQHIGAKRDTQLGYTWTFHAVNVLTDLDPTFVPPYQATGLFLGVLVGRQNEGLAILEKGIRRNPSSWQLPFLAGYVSYYELCNPVEGGKYLRLAAGIPGSPSYLPQLAARMTVESGDPTAALDFLDRFSRNVNDERVREALLQRMKEIIQEKDLNFLEESIRRYRTKYAQSPSKLEDLMLRGIIHELPTDPLGGEYEIDAINGIVRATSRQERLRIHEKVACQAKSANVRHRGWAPPIPVLD